MAFSSAFVVGRSVRHGVAMLCALVDLGAVARAGFVKRPLERADLLGAHAWVLVGEAEIELGFQLAGREVGTVRSIGHKAAGVEPGETRDAVRVGYGDPPSDSRAH